MIPYALFIMMIFSLVILIYAKYRHLSTLSIISKAITSLFFILICIAGQIIYQGNLMYFSLILTALSFSLLGDVFLAFPIDIPNGTHENFIRGLMCFAFAHIFFSMSFISITQLSLKGIVLFLLLFTILLITLKLIRGFHYNGMLPFVVFYSLIISFMVSTAISLLNMIDLYPGALITTLGAGLFLISDIILSFIYFHEKNIKHLTALNLIAYYIGQGLIALSILYF